MGPTPLMKIRMTTFALAFAVFALQAGTAPVAAQEPPPKYDVLILGGRVLDGTGNAFFRADIGVSQGVIHSMGRLNGSSADRVIDATGLYVAPGFIDIHSHATTALTAPEPEGRNAHNLLTQGVTTVVGASDGTNALWPLTREIEAYRESPGIALNVLPMVGHNSLREAVMGEDYRRQATAEEERQMQGLLRQGMQIGAWGMGAGLEGDVGRHSTTGELVGLAQVLGDFDGFYVAHQRSDQGGRLPGWMLPGDADDWPLPEGIDWGADAVRETVEVAERSGIRVVASHVKAAGRASWGRSAEDVRLVREARAEGHQVYMDVYPYSVIGGGARPLLPGWAFEPQGTSGEGDLGRRNNLRRNLEDSETRGRIERDTEYLVDLSGGPDKLVIIDHPDPSLRGRVVGTIAQERGVSTVELLLDFAMTGYDLEKVPEGAWIRGSALHELDIERYMQQDFTATASDAGIVDVAGGYDRGPPSHPRYYGAFVRRMARYVKDRQTTSLPYAIRAATSLPAQITGLKDRGLLREGLAGDIIVFDLDALRDHATTVHSKAHSSGIEYVLVNGVVSVDHGVLTRNLAGRVLLKAQPN